MRNKSCAIGWFCSLLICIGNAAALAQVSEPATRPSTAITSTRPTTAPATQPIVVPDLRTLLSAPQSQIAMVSERYDVDRRTLARFYDLPLAPTRIERLRKFDQSWQAALARIDA